GSRPISQTSRRFTTPCTTTRSTWRGTRACTVASTAPACRVRRAFRADSPATLRPMLQFWFDFGSTYSYVAALRVEDQCVRAGLEVEDRPFLLGAIFTELLGIKDSSFNAQPVRGRNMWRDVVRLCEKYAVRWRR